MVYKSINTYLIRGTLPTECYILVSKISACLNDLSDIVLHEKQSGEFL